MGHVNPKELWYSVRGESVLEDRLVLLVDDKGAMHMATISMINGVVHLYVVHRMTEPEVINMIEGVVVDKEVHKEVEGDGETEKDLDDGEVNGEEEIDNHDVQETDAEIEKELGDGEVNGEKEIDNDDVQDIDAEVEENLHEVDEVDEVEAYDEESDEEGDDTTTKLLLRSFVIKGLWMSMLKVTQQMSLWMVMWNVKMEVLQKTLQEHVLPINNNVVIHMRMRLEE